MKPYLILKDRKLLTSVFVAWLLFAMVIGVWQIKPAQAAYLFGDGFESGDLTAWTSNNGGTASTTEKKTGTYSYLTNNDYQRVRKDVSSLSEVWFQFYYHLDTATSSGDRWYITGDNTGAKFCLAVKDAGAGALWQFAVLNDADALILYNDTTGPALDTWYKIKLWWKGNTASGAKLWVDDVLKITASGTTHNYALTSLDLKEGLDAGGVKTQYFDDAIIADADIVTSPVDGLPLSAQYVIQNSTAYSQIRGSDNVTLMTHVNFTYLAQLALNNLTTGQQVCFNGTITQDGQLTIPISNIKLNWWKANVTVTNPINSMYMLSKSNITIINGAFYGRNDTELGVVQYAIKNWYSDNVYIFNASINNFSWMQGAIQMNGAENLIIQNCSFDNFDNYAAVFNNCTDIIIANNTVDCNNIGSAFGAFGTSAFSYPNDHNLTIANNTIINVGAGLGHSYHVLYVGAMNETDIYGNTMAVSTNSPAMSLRSSGLLFHNNTLSVPSGHAFQIWEEDSGAQDVNGTKIYNNTLIGGDAVGSYCFYQVGGYGFSDILFENNTISHWGGDMASSSGVFRLNGQSNSKMAENITFRWNTITDCGGLYGAIVVGGDNLDGSDTYISNLKIMNNTFTNQPSPTIRIQNGSTQVEIGYNMLTACAAPVMWNRTESIWMHDNTGLDDYLGSEYHGVIMTVSSPTNTTYTSGTIPVELTATGGTIDIIWWNCKNGTDWIYGSNQTYTVATSMTGFVNGTSYKFYGWANNTDGNSDEKSVMFTVEIASSGEPVIGSPSASTTVEASTCTISSTLTDDVGLAEGILSTNGTSAWVNNTAKSLSGLSYAFSDTVALPSAGTIFGYKLFVSDSAGQWTTSNTQTFITTSQGSTLPQGPPSGGYSRFLCMFTVSSNGRALQDLKIRLWENNYSVLIETLQTDSEGYVETELPSGTYEYSADFGGQTKRGYVLLDDAKKITIDFDSAQKSTFDRSSLIKVSFALVVVACAIVALLAVKNRH